VIVRAPVDLAE